MFAYNTPCPKSLLHFFIAIITKNLARLLGQSVLGNICTVQSERIPPMVLILDGNSELVTTFFATINPKHDLRLLD